MRPTRTNRRMSNGELAGANPLKLDEILRELLQEDDGKRAKAFVEALIEDATDTYTRGRAQLAQMVWDRMLGPVAFQVESESLDAMVKRAVSVKGTDVGKRATMPGEEEGEDE